MVVFEKKSQCSATPSMILNMKNITRCDKFIPKLVPYYLVYCTYLCKQTGAANCVCFKVKTEKITVQLGKIIITSPLGH